MFIECCKLYFYFLILKIIIYTLITADFLLTLNQIIIKVMLTLNLKTMFTNWTFRQIFITNINKSMSHTNIINYK